MMTKLGDKTGTCGCGRSPTGQCIGWHGLTEESYMDKLNLWIAEQAQTDKEENETTLGRTV